MKKIIVLVMAVFSMQLVISQEKTSKKELVDFSASLQTNHLWRGLIITDKPMLGVITTFSISNNVTAGVWGGMAFSNDNDDTHYKEIDYYVQYAANGFSIGLWDLFNTRGAQNVDIWNYKENETRHLLDLRTSYNFGKDFPLTLEMDVLLYGSGDREADRTETKQRYSTYAQLSYPLVQNRKVNLNGFVGAGFALNGNTHLYGDGKNKFDVVNVGFTASRKVRLSGVAIPVSVTTLWNPSLKVARVQLAVSMF